MEKTFHMPELATVETLCKAISKKINQKTDAGENLFEKGKAAGEWYADFVESNIPFECRLIFSEGPEREATVFVYCRMVGFSLFSPIIVDPFPQIFPGLVGTALIRLKTVEVEKRISKAIDEYIYQVQLIASLTGKNE